MTTTLCPLLLVMAALGATSEQRLGNVVCRLEFDRSEIPLSGELRLTLSVEGPAPVEVEPPRPLSPSPDWRVRAAQPRTIPLPGGRERWEQTFRLDPYQLGRVALPLEPLRFRTQNELRDRSVTWPPFEVQVTSEVTDAELSKARGVTGIDELPLLPSARYPWPIAIAIGIIAALGLAAVALLLRRRAQKPALSPRDHAITELFRLEAENSPDVVQRLADLVRCYLEAHCALAATRLTTAEFLNSLREHNVLTAEQINAVADLLRQGDLAKFAGQVPSVDERSNLLAAARRLIAETSPASEN